MCVLLVHDNSLFSAGFYEYLVVDWIDTDCELQQNSFGARSRHVLLNVHALLIGWTLVQISCAGRDIKREQYAGIGGCNGRLSIQYRASVVALPNLSAVDR